MHGSSPHIGLANWPFRRSLELLIAEAAPLRLRSDRAYLSWRAAPPSSADNRPAWSCAKRNPFSECRGRSYWELPRVSRSRMATSVGSIAGASNHRPALGRRG
jgi:hypothetical protein